MLLSRGHPPPQWGTSTAACLAEHPGKSDAQKGDTAMKRGLWPTRTLVTQPSHRRWKKQQGLVVIQLHLPALGTPPESRRGPSQVAKGQEDKVHTHQESRPVGNSWLHGHKGRAADSIWKGVTHKLHSGSWVAFLQDRGEQPRGHVQKPPILLCWGRLGNDRGGGWKCIEDAEHGPVHHVGEGSIHYFFG